LQEKLLHLAGASSNKEGIKSSTYRRYCTTMAKSSFNAQALLVVALLCAGFAGALSSRVLMDEAEPMAEAADQDRLPGIALSLRHRGNSVILQLVYMMPPRAAGS
jgi:hypothetical protein